MKSSTTPSFWRAYRALIPEIQEEAHKAYQLWKANPRHPSLRFERKGDFWSVRITRGCALWHGKHEGTFYWFWIGSHDEYQRLIRS